MMGSIYEANTLMTLREMMALNAVDDPILIRGEEETNCDCDSNGIER